MQKEKTFLGMLLVASLTILLLAIWVHRDPFTELEPKSPSGVQLVAKTGSEFRGSVSRVFIKYPDQEDLVRTDVIFEEDEGGALSDPRDGNPLIEWIDDHHVSITYKGRAYGSPDTKIIEY